MLNTKFDKIRLIRTRNKIYPISKYFDQKHDEWKYKNGYKCLKLDQLLSSEFDDFEIIAMQTANGDVTTFLNLFNNMDIVELFHVYTLKCAVEFQEPAPIKQ